MKPTRPKLPPKAGFVEVVEEGVHKYKPLSSAARLEEMSAQLTQATEAIGRILALLAKLGLGEGTHE